MTRDRLPFLKLLRLVLPSRQQNRESITPCKAWCSAWKLLKQAPETANMGTRKTFDIGRDSKNGQFITVEEAERRPTTTQVERVPKPGYGDTRK